MSSLERIAGALALAGVGLVTVIAAGSPSAAAVQARTAKFTIANMTCATCPIAVKTAISKVAGVQSVNVNFETKTATVVFDPSRANAAQIAAASDAIGFSATLTR